MAQIQRNDPCPCGSGKKYKKCCMGGGGAAQKNFSLNLSRISVKNRYIYAGLIIIFFLSIFLRYYGFNQPHRLTFDEGLYAELLGVQLSKDITNYSTQVAYQKMTAERQSPPLPKYLDRPLFKHPPLYCYFIALSYKFFGVSKLSAVSVSILLGGLTVLVVFFLGTVLYDERVGLLAAAFLCIEPVHWVCSERIWMETTLTFFVLLGVFLFVLGRKQKHYLILSGLSIGLAMLTKYPGILALFIVISFVLFFDRSLLKSKGFWMLCFLSFLVFFPWVIWNWRVSGDLNEGILSVHNLVKRKDKVLDVLLPYKGFLLALLPLAGLLLVLRKKIKALIGVGTAEHLTPGRKNFLVRGCLLLFIFSLAAVPFFRGMIKEAFIFRNTIFVAWFNPFHNGPWHFYLTRLSELSPLYIFSYFSVFLFLGRNKGDKLMIISAVWILVAFILWGNYQSRYILPAVPFLVILSARWQVWAYDKLSGPRISQVILKTLLVAISAYFIIKTLKVDSLIAIGPDFGYF